MKDPAARLATMLRTGTGKRPALARGVRALRRARPMSYSRGSAGLVRSANKNMSILSLDDDRDLERSHAVGEAYERLAGYVHDNGFSMDLQEIDGGLEVSHCLIHGGDYSDFGSGKGPHHRAGAIAEAIEHSVLRKPEYPTRRSLSISGVSEQRALAAEAYTQYLAKNAPRDTVGTSRFRCVSSGLPVDVPAGLVAPDFFEQGAEALSETDLKFQRYCTNNGCALGLDRSEALLHGLNEAIERHYESLLYLELLGLSGRAEWFLFQENGESPFNRKKARVETAFGPTVTLVSRTSFRSFVALSVQEHPLQGYSSQIGAGSSLYLGIALRRSMDELAQALVLTSPEAPGCSEFKREEQLLLDRVQEQEGLEPIVLLSGERLLNYGARLACESKDIVQPWIPVSEQLSLLLSGLERDHTVLVRWFDAGPSLCACQVFIPSFERTFMLKKGILAAPSEHYRRRLEAVVAHQLGRGK